ncbi:MAG: glycosyl transferase [Rhizobacter sp.]|nr:glycosyl transferase [Rhizobacter sp.]
MNAVRDAASATLPMAVPASEAVGAEASRTSSRRLADSALAVLAFTLFWLGFTSWIRPLALPDEGRYVGVAWEMLRSGDWLTPTLDGLPFFHKPPLFYWITASSLSTFGMNAWAGRVAPWLGASAVAFGLYLFSRRWAGPRMARASLLVLLTQPLFFMGAQYANLDMLIAGCIGVTILAAAHAVQCLRAGLPYRGWLVAAYALAAFGVLAKGLIGIVLPVAVLLLWLAWSQTPRRAVGLVGRLVSLPGLVVFLALAAPWFIAMQERFPDFFHYFFVVQHFQRFAGSGFNNVRPFWFFVPVLLVLTLPWSAWLWRAVRRHPGEHLERFGRIGLDAAIPVESSMRESLTASVESAGTSKAVRQLMWTWLAVILVFFSIPGSKLVGYILPACAPLAFLMADAGRRAWSARRGDKAWRPRRQRWWKASAVLAAVLCLAIVGIVCAVDRSSTRSLAQAYVAKARHGEPLVMLGDYFYDIPLYVASRSPIAVVDDWSRPTIGSRDNWEKEMTDAATFAPGRGASVLIDTTAFPAILCDASVHWLIAPRAAAERYPWLAALAPAASSHRASIWRIDLADPAVAAALNCRRPPKIRTR